MKLSERMRALGAEMKLSERMRVLHLCRLFFVSVPFL